MKCRSCAGEVRDGQRFCQSCGAALEKKCQGCGATAPLQARFCGMCGGVFATEPQASSQTLPHSDPPGPAPSDGERRQLTVLFADVVGATALSGSLDPESLRNVLRAYQQVCADCVNRFGGNIHQYAGDGVVARKHRTVDVLIAWLDADAQEKPMVMVVEDLHWVDASTRELLGTLLERIADMPIMVVLTFRPEFVPAWALHGQISTLPLARLTSDQSIKVAMGVIVGKGPSGGRKTPKTPNSCAGT